MKWYWWLLIVILVYGLFTNVYTLNNFMDNPLDNVIDSTGGLLDKTMDTLNLDNPLSDEASDKINYGKPNCIENSDCNTIEECKIDLCACSGGECYG